MAKTSSRTTAKRNKRLNSRAIESRILRIDRMAKDKRARRLRLNNIKTI